MADPVSSIFGPLFSAATGGKGGQFPGFNAGPGGVSPEQAALGQYTLGQNLLASGSEFANTGTGASTMRTQAAGGARNAEALQLAETSNRNQQAAAQIATQQFQQQQSLNQLAQQANQQAGQAAGFGAGLEGSFGSGTSGAAAGA